MGRTCGIFRLTTVYNSTAGAWRYTVDAVCISVYLYTDCMAVEVNSMPSVHGSTAGRKHGIPMQQWVYYVRYTNTVYTRHHHRFATPGCVYRACVRVRACVCVRACVILLYYYNIIILLYLYIPNISSIPSIPNIPSISNIPNNGNIAL